MGREYDIRVSDERPDEPAIDLMVHLIVLMGRQLALEVAESDERQPDDQLGDDEGSHELEADDQPADGTP